MLSEAGTRVSAIWLRLGCGSRAGHWEWPRRLGCRVVLAGHVLFSWLVTLTWRFCLLQFDDHLISPKEFVHLAGKSTLKDWKRAIRMNGIMLRWVPSFVLHSDSGGFFFLGITLGPRAFDMIILLLKREMCC